MISVVVVVCLFVLSYTAIYCNVIRSHTQHFFLTLSIVVNNELVDRGVKTFRYKPEILHERAFTYIKPFCLIQTRAQRASAMDKRLRSNSKSRKRKTALKNSYGPQLLRPGLRSNGRRTYVKIIDNYVILYQSGFQFSVKKSKLLGNCYRQSQEHRQSGGPIEVQPCSWHYAREKN